MFTAIILSLALALCMWPIKQIIKWEHNYRHVHKSLGQWVMFKKKIIYSTKFLLLLYIQIVIENYLLGYFNIYHY